MNKRASWSNEEWLAFLEESHPSFNAAVDLLHCIIYRSLRKSFRFKMSREHLEDMTQDSIIRILGRKDSFHGDSRFLTWAIKVSVNLTLTELRRKRWEDVSIESLNLDVPLFKPESVERDFFSPEKTVMRRSVAETLNRLIAAELSVKQREALLLVVHYGLPAEEAAKRLGTNRNALYKLLHDARKRLRDGMEVEGLSRMEIVSVLMVLLVGCHIPRFASLLSPVRQDIS